MIEIQNIKREISKITKSSKAKISYDGLLKGREYIEFLQKCHIGLSTQNPNAAFNDTSFPSKVLSYMSNGLSVVSIRIKAIEESKVGDYICFYEIQKSEEIAKAIINANINNNNREVLEKLSAEYKIEIRKLINDFF